MRATVVIILVALAVAALAACGGSDTPLYPDIYVNPALGSDSTGDGTYIRPYKTITMAMSKAASGNVVRAELGTYSASSGETFPIHISNGVALIGDEITRGALTVIDGSGSFGIANAAVVTGENSMIAGFQITGDPTAGNGAVYVNRNNVVVRNNTLTGSYWGLFSDNGPATVKVQGNVIKANAHGVRLVHTGMDLGGGSAGSAGGNHLICNLTYDVYLEIDGAMAKNNYWDNPAPIYNAVGNDIYVVNPGDTIDTTGSAKSEITCL